MRHVDKLDSRKHKTRHGLWRVGLRSGSNFISQLILAPATPIIVTDRPSGWQDKLKVTIDDMGISGHTSEELVYHLELLLDVGFVDANVGMLPVMVRGLTWNGHEFLANIKNDDL